MASWFNKGKHELGSGTTVYTTATIKVLLVTSGYVLNIDHDFVDDITNEVTGGGYVRQTLGTKVVTNNTTSDRTEFDAADSTFTNVTATNMNAAIAFRDTGTASTSPLLWYLDFTAQSPAAADVTLQWNSSGLAHIT
jgi:hypothetical protein